MKLWAVFVGFVALGSACAAKSESGADGGAGGKGGTGASGGSGGQAGDASAADGSSDSKTCAADEISCGGVCVVAADCSFALTSIEPPSGWQNGHGWVKLHGAGFAAGAKVTIGTGVAPARVLDASTILIETPPGPLGAQDVTVSAGAASATLKSGFTY